jgi:hypothetical protein
LNHHRSRRIQRFTHDIQFRVLIPHRRSYILVSRGFHHSRQIPRLLQDSGAVIVATAIQNQIFRQAGFVTRCAKQLPEVAAKLSP